MSMEDNRNTGYPISTFKVDFGCSKGCPADVSNMLQNLKGVKSISIDPNQGIVTVVGNVNPTTLIKIFEKNGKKAQLHSFVKEPKKSHSHSKHKHHSHYCCESSDSEDEFETDHSGDHHMHRYDFGNDMTRHHGPPMSGYHYQQPLPSYHHYRPHPPPMPWNQHMAYAYARPPPPLPLMHPRPGPMYGYYGSGQPMRPTYGYYDSRFPRYHPHASQY